LTGCRLAQEWSRSSCVIGGGCGGSKGTCKSTDERISVSRLPVIVSTLSEILNFLVADKWELQWGPIFKNSKTSFLHIKRSTKMHKTRQCLVCGFQVSLNYLSDVTYKKKRNVKPESIFFPALSRDVFMTFCVSQNKTHCFKKKLQVR
jgi:hypothetical protein